MSAFMVSKIHIDRIVATAYRGPRDARNLPQSGHWYRPVFDGSQQWAADQLDAVGEMLVKENLSSIHSRYPDTLTDPDSTPGPCEQYWLQPYEFDWQATALGTVQALKAIACYEYQSCEHEEWARSQARRFCESLRSGLISCLPGYDAAEWELEMA